jgi:hypothetical protein
MSQQSALRWRLSVLGTVCFTVSAFADAPELSPAALEEQAEAEFALVSRAVHERLEHEASGDLLGAKAAAEEAENHRQHFLDLKREIARLTPTAPSHPSVQAPRSPVSPDQAFMQRTSGARYQASAVAADGAVSHSRATYPVWDMYRPHEPTRVAQPTDAPEQARVSRDLRSQPDDERVAHSNSSERAEAPSGAMDSAPAAAAGNAVPNERPREPLRVYREEVYARARD